VRYDRDINNFEELLRKVELLQNCDQNILITDFDRTYKLTEYVAKFTNNHINVVFRTTKIIEILENERLASLDRLARIFNERTRMYIYPVDSNKVDKTLQADPSQPLFTLSNYKPTDLNINLYRHLITSRYIQELTNYDEDLAKWDSESAALVKKKDAKVWKNLLACQAPE
jgi:hypothetical protein